VTAFEPRRLRQTVLRMSKAGSTVHIACAFSLVEILAVLYRSHLRLGSDGPCSPGRDYLVLSKGHGVMAQYACLRELGWLTEDDVQNYFGNGTILKGLADAHVPGVEVSSGSLGHGLSVGGRSASAWPWRPSDAAPASGFTRSSATASATRAPSGRRCCSPPTSTWTT
jgi:transketolase N-terminal domain/subunit